MLSPEQFIAARYESESSREQKRGQAVYARSLAEGFYREYYEPNDNLRWRQAKARATLILLGNQR